MHANEEVNLSYTSVPMLLSSIYNRSCNDLESNCFILMAPPFFSETRLHAIDFIPDLQIKPSLQTAHSST
jgi:hypothetical protein